MLSLSPISLSLCVCVCAFLLLILVSYRTLTTNDDTQPASDS